MHWKDWCWSSNTLATWCKEPTHWKDPDAGKIWGQEEKGMTEDEMVHGISNSMDMTLSKLQEMVKEGGLACCNPCGRKESDTTLQLNDKQLLIFIYTAPCVKYNWRWLQVSLVAQIVKNLHEMPETRVQSLTWEYLLQKETATHFSILAWKMPWTEEPEGYSAWGHKKS